MRVVSTLAGADNLTVDGVEYHAVDGVFDLPHDLGLELVKFGEWDEEFVAAGRAADAKAAADRDPERILARLVALEAKVFGQAQQVTEDALTEKAARRASTEAKRQATWAAKRAAASESDGVVESGDDGE
jgi:cell division septum initiation protein DivIVA